MTTGPTRRSDLSKPFDEVRQDLFGDDPQPPPGWVPPMITPDDLAAWNASSCHVLDSTLARAGIPEHFVREFYPKIEIIKPYDPTREDTSDGL